jgi:hypothetical protein
VDQGYKRILFTSERAGILSIVQETHYGLTNEIFTRRHGYQFTKLNKIFVFKLAGMFILVSINATDVPQMIILCC